MFCTNCGNEVEEHACFCSRCGNRVARPGKAAPDMQMHVTILGWLFLGSGVLLGLVAFVVVLIGQLLSRGPVPFPPDVPADFVTWIMAMVGLGLTALAAGTAAAGVGLLQYRGWARGLTVVMSALMLFNFPVGTAIAVYAFWVLFSNQGREFYKSRSTDTITVSGI